MVRRKRLVGLVLILLLGLPFTVQGAEKTPLARVEVQPTRVEWLPAADQKSLTLTVAGPDGFYLERDLRAGESPAFSALDFQDNRLPDGVYAYELRAEGAAVQSGHLWVHEGRFVDKLPADVKPPIRNITALEEVIPEDLIVQGHACIGDDCDPGDASDTPPLKIKGEFANRQILFDGSCCYPTERDWALQAGDFSGGSPNGDFLVRDLTAGTVPFRIGAGAVANALTILYNGNIGLGTLTPASQLHIRGTDTGFRNRIFVENASGTTSPREMLEIRNNGSPVFILKDTTVPQRWGIGTLGGSLVNDNQANAGLEFTLGATGNLTIAGTLTQNSDRTTKHDIVAVQPEEILGKVLDLPIATWVRKGDEARHLGPMAQDFAAAFGLGEDDRHIATIDMAGVSLASIQALNGRMASAIAQKDAEIETLRQKSSDLAARVETLEKMISTLLEQNAAATPNP